MLSPILTAPMRDYFVGTQKVLKKSETIRDMILLSYCQVVCCCWAEWQIAAIIAAPVNARHVCWRQRNRKKKCMRQTTMFWICCRRRWRRELNHVPVMHTWWWWWTMNDEWCEVTWASRGIFFFSRILYYVYVICGWKQDFHFLRCNFNGQTKKNSLFCSTTQ